VDTLIHRNFQVTIPFLSSSYNGKYMINASLLSCLGKSQNNKWYFHRILQLFHSWHQTN